MREKQIKTKNNNERYIKLQKMKRRKQQRAKKGLQPTFFSQSWLFETSDKNNFLMIESKLKLQNPIRKKQNIGDKVIS